MIDGLGTMKQNVHRRDGLENVEGDIRMEIFTLRLSLNKGHETRTTRVNKREEQKMRKEMKDKENYNNNGVMGKNKKIKSEKNKSR
jgi:hypothetical protein